MTISSLLQGCIGPLLQVIRLIISIILKGCLWIPLLKPLVCMRMLRLLLLRIPQEFCWRQSCLFRWREALKEGNLWKRLSLSWLLIFRKELLLFGTLRLCLPNTLQSIMNLWILCWSKRLSDIIDCWRLWLRHWCRLRKPLREKLLWVKIWKLWQRIWVKIRSLNYGNQEVSCPLNPLLHGLKILTKGFNSSMNGSKREHPKSFGFQVSSSHKPSSQVLFKTTQEDTLSLSMSSPLSSTSSTIEVTWTLQRSQKMVVTSTECTSKVPDGTATSTLLKSPGPRNYIQIFLLFIWFQPGIDTHLLAVSITVLSIRCSRELVLWVQLAIPPTLLCLSNCLPRSPKMCGLRLVLLLSWLWDIEGIGC